VKTHISRQLTALTVLLGVTLVTAAIAAEPDQGGVEYEAYKDRRKLHIHLTAYALKTFGKNARLGAMLGACDLNGLGMAILASEDEVSISLLDELVKLLNLSPSGELTPIVKSQTDIEQTMSIESAAHSLDIYRIGYMDSTKSFLSSGILDRGTYCARAAKQADEVLSERSQKAADDADSK